MPPSSPALSRTTGLRLYGTDGCHLCEDAAALLEALALSADTIDIADDDALQERYGLRIPVLVRADGAELGWPFAAAEVLAFIAASGLEGRPATV